MKILDIVNGPWAIYPPNLQEIVGIYSTHLRGEKIDLKALEAQLGRPIERKEQGYTVRNGVGLIPIDGVISRRMNLLGQISGGASTDLIQRDVLASEQDAAVHARILYIESPGGSVDGIQETAQTIFDSAARKPLVTLVDSRMLSAAAWLGVAASEVYLSADTNMTGSLGVVTKHVNVQKREAQIGIETTELSSGKYKRIASEYGPLTDEGRAYMQEMLDKVYAVMVDDVARLRAVSADTVLESMAEGRVFVGRDAIKAGLVDGVSTLDALVADLQHRRPARRAPART